MRQLVPGESHFSDIYWTFSALIFLLEPKGRGKKSCVGPLYCEYSKAWRYEGSMGSEFGTTAGWHVWLLFEIVHKASDVFDQKECFI
jgi:hypothetical protein